MAKSREELMEVRKQMIAQMEQKLHESYHWGQGPMIGFYSRSMWFDAYHSADGKRLVINTKQLSQ